MLIRIVLGLATLTLAGCNLGKLKQSWPTGSEVNYVDELYIHGATPETVTTGRVRFVLTRLGCIIQKSSYSVLGGGSRVCSES